MQLEIGKKYRTRNGLVVKIISDIRNVTEYRFIGSFEDGGHGTATRSWNQDGRYSAAPHHKFDLMEEVYDSQPTKERNMKQAAAFNLEVGDEVKLSQDKDERTYVVKQHTGVQVLFQEEATGWLVLHNLNSEVFLLPVATINGIPFFRGDKINFCIDLTSKEVLSGTIVSKSDVNNQRINVITGNGNPEEWDIPISSIILPKKEKWFNIYQSTQPNFDVEGHAHDTEEKALKAIDHTRKYLGTVSIEV